MTAAIERDAEWLEADGLGGFASGTVSGERTRRYHALLLTASEPPGGRRVLVNGLDAAVETEGGRFALSSQRYAPDVVSPDGATRIDSFSADPWPRWTFALGDGTSVEQEIFVPRGRSLVAVRWRLRGRQRPATLTVRPFLSGRDYHALHHENDDFSFAPTHNGDQVTFRPYASLPPVTVLANGGYVHEPVWYRSFLYREERARGLDHVEDLAAPGTFRFDLEDSEAVMIFTAAEPSAAPRAARAEFAGLQRAESERRGAFRSRLERAGDAYFVRRGSGQTIIAGYPWFQDWGRDTFIALRGLALATGRLVEAQAILFEWAHQVSEGMLPNRFADDGDVAEFNSVDAALWYVVAVHEYLDAMAARGATVPACHICGAGAACLEQAVLAILTGYSGGTRHCIRMDSDGLLAAGESGVQLTWMDAKVGDWVVTPRIGKPVEIEALWLNALAIGARFDPRWLEPLARGRRAFAERFWNAETGYLHDVVDAGHRRGENDASIRPNAVFAVGGLPFPLLEGEKARAVLARAEELLLTPLGLRSLVPEATGYAPRYQGGVRDRDGSYHQGTVWPWLLGAFVEAWMRVHGDTAANRATARRRFLEPLFAHLEVAGLGHVSEIADGDAPHTPRGCPFQAWSVGEALRLDLAVLSAGGQGEKAFRTRNRRAPAASNTRKETQEPAARHSYL